MKATACHRGAILPLLFLLLAAVFLLKNTEIAANGIKKGLNLASTALIPSLLPFLVLSNLMIETGAITPLTRLMEKPLHLAFGLSKNGTAALLLGVLCGLPVGTVSAITMLKNGQISKKEFDRLLLISGTPSTGFLISAVGRSLFGNVEAGAVLFLLALFSCAVTGVILRLLDGNLETPSHFAATTAPKIPFYTQFTGAVRQGFATALEITGFVAFFSALAECVRTAARQYARLPIWSVLPVGLLELTAGVHEAAGALPSESAFCLCAFFVGFAGLSVCMQLFSISAAARPRLLPYLGARLFQGLLCSLLATLYLALRRPVFRVASQSAIEANATLGTRLPLFTLTTAFLAILFCLTLPALFKARLVRFVRTKK